GYADLRLPASALTVIDTSARLRSLNCLPSSPLLRSAVENGGQFPWPVSSADLRRSWPPTLLATPASMGVHGNLSSGRGNGCLRGSSGGTLVRHARRVDGDHADYGRNHHHESRTEVDASAVDQPGGGERRETAQHTRGDVV